MEKKTIIWLEDNPRLSPYVPSLVSERQFSLLICETLLDFKRQCDLFLTNTTDDKLAGFIIDAVISNAASLDDLEIRNVDARSGTDIGMLVVRDYLLCNVKFANLPILILTVLQSPETAYQSIVKTNRFSNSSIPSNVAFVVKGMQYDGAPFIQSISDWLNKI